VRSHRPEACALHATPLVAAQRRRCPARASSTRPRITAELSAATFESKLTSGTGVSVTCMSMRSANGPDKRDRYLTISDSAHTHGLVGCPRYEQGQGFVAILPVVFDRRETNSRLSRTSRARGRPHPQAPARSGSHAETRGDRARDERLELPFRTLFRTPFVTIVAILSLGLGIGANAGIYSLFNEILLAPLPVAHPDRLVNFASPGPQVMYYNCGTAGDCDEAYDYPMFRDLERAAPKTAFSGIAGHMPFNVSLVMPGQTPITGDGVLVSGSYFPVLGIQPALGRLLDRTVDQPIEGMYVTVLSYAFWENVLGGNPAVLGKQITVNGQPLTIIGVAPRGFSGTTLGVRPDVFVPISMAGLMIDGWKGVETDRDEHFVYIFGRLVPGATMEQAAASLNPTYHAIINDVEARVATKPRIAAVQQRW
jgi:MacB-like periplasmic core domain